MDRASVDRLLDKLMAFVRFDLDSDERAVLGRLLAPGVAEAFEVNEVSGFTFVKWGASSDVLARALQDRGIRVVGLDPDGST